MIKCCYCKAAKLKNGIIGETELCIECLEGLQINWLEVIENDAYSYEVGRTICNSAKKRII